MTDTLEQVRLATQRAEENIKQTCNNCAMNCFTPKHSNKQPKPQKSAAS